jgi:hypothetical protein
VNDKNIEMMKKIIEQKKQKGKETKSDKKPKKVIGKMLLHSGRTTQ